MHVILNQFCYCEKKNNHYLFYNTLNNECQILHDKEISFANQLAKRELVEIKEKDFTNINKAIIDNLINKNIIAEVSNDNLTKKQPFIYEPFIKITHSHNSKEENNEYFTSHGALDNIREVIVEISTTTNKKYKYANKQFKYPEWRQEKHTIDIKNLYRILSNLKYVNTNISFVIGDINKSENHDQILSIINRCANASLYLHLNSANLNIINSVSNNIYIYAYIDNDTDNNTICNIKHKKTSLIQIISNNKELNTYKKNDIQKCGKEIDIKPYFNLKNMNFFKKNVFIDFDDIFAKKKDMRQIMTKKNINDIFYGKITISVCGKIYLSKNLPSVGNIEQHSLNEVVYKGMRKNSLWFKTRDQVDDCTNCLLTAFCPCISNYELFMNVNKICILQNEDKYLQK